VHDDFKPVMYYNTNNSTACFTFLDASKACDRVRYCTVVQNTDLSTFTCMPVVHGGLAVWLSGDALASINVVALRQTWLVLGWVTACGRVNHFGM